MSKKKTTEEFIEDAVKIHGCKYDYSLVEYEGNKIPVKILCKKHNIFFKQRPNDHLTGHGCKLCALEEASKKLSSSKEKFVEKAKEKYGNKFDYSKVEYVNENTKVEIICPLHGEIKVTPVFHFVSPKGCPACGLESKKLDVEAIQEKLSSVKDMSFSDIQPSSSHSSEYLVTGACKLCGRKTTKTVHYFLYDFKKCQCQKTGDFFGECETKAFLTESKISYIRNKKFSDLKDIRELSYDFYLPEQNLLIEIQGEQHYKPKNFGGILKEKAIENFLLQKKHDLMKQEYAERNNFDFLEISYKDFGKIKKILKEKIIDKN